MNKSKVTKWTCDICKVATFDSFEAAAKHEELCKKKLITVWTCDICKERDFTSLEEATAHEKICAQQMAEKKKRQELEKKRQILSQQRKKQQQLQVQQQQQQNQAAVYVCDICKDAVFHSVEEAKRHEESCSKRRRDGVADRKGNLNITVCKPAKYDTKDMATKSTIYNNIKEVTNVNELPNMRSMLQEKANTGTVIAPQMIQQSKPVTSTVPRPTPKDSTVYIDTLPESPPKNTPQTTGFSNATSMSLEPSPIKNASQSNVRDSLPSASKPTASSIVTGRNNESAIVLDEDDKDAVNTISPQEVTKSLSFTTIPERKEVFIPILQPICNNDANDIQLFSRLASVHRHILASVDLCEVQVVDRTKSEVSCNWITFRCTHCKYKFNKEWTKRSMGLELPLNAYAHLVRNCPSVPDEAKDVMKMTNPVIPADREGKIEFRDFTDKFCSQLGLVNALVSNNGEEAKKRLILPTSSPLRAQNANLEPTQSNDQVRTVSANSSANSVSNSTADSEVSPRATTKLPQARNKRKIPVTSPMFPLVLQDDDTIYKQLSPFNMAAVTEIMFTIDQDNVLLSPPGYKRVVLRCKHCGSSSRVTGVDSWHKTVYAMSYSHLSKTCHFIPPSKREKIVEGKKKIGGSGNTYIGLKQYCEYVSQRYNFTDAKSDIPGILVKYNGPSYDEVNGSHQTRKRPRSQTNTDSANDTYLSKHKYLSLFSNSQTSITVKNPNDFNEKNRTSDLIPRGAIPLVFSLTKEKSSKLNAMNKIIVDNFELCEQIKPIDQASQTDLRLALRCQNCNYKPTPFVRQLSGINSWYLDLIECSSHLKDCPCIQESVKRSLVKARQKNDEGEVSMKEYCDFLVELYGFADRESNGDECVGVKWGECKYVVENYSSKPEKIRSRSESDITGSNKYPIRRVPQHSLMLSPDSTSTEHQKKENLGLTEVPLTPVIRPYILSDFNYLLVGQLEFVIIAPKALAKKRSSRNSMASLSMNNDSSKEQFVHLGAKCRHCRHTKRISTIAKFTNDRKYEEFIHHFHHCRRTPDDIRFHLNEFRAQHEIQKNWGGVASIQEYLRKIMIDTYRVEDAKEDGIANIILRNEYMQNAKDVCNEINRRDADDDQMLRLPLLIPKMLEPVSMDTKKIAFMKSVVNDMKDSDSGNEGMDEFSDENDSDKQDAIEKSDNGISEVEVSDDDKMSIEKDDPQDDDMDSTKNSQQADAEDTSIASVESSSSSDDDWV